MDEFIVLVQTQGFHFVLKKVFNRFHIVVCYLFLRFDNLGVGYGKVFVQIAQYGKPA